MADYSNVIGPFTTRFNPINSNTVTERVRTGGNDTGAPLNDTLGVREPQDSTMLSSEAAEAEARRHAWTVAQNSAFYDTADTAGDGVDVRQAGNGGDGIFGVQNVTGLGQFGLDNFKKDDMKPGEAEAAQRQAIKDRLNALGYQDGPTSGDPNNTSLDDRITAILAASNYYGKPENGQQLTAFDTATGSPADNKISTGDANRVGDALSYQNDIDSKVTAIKNAYEAEDPKKFEETVNADVNNQGRSYGDWHQTRNDLKNTEGDPLSAEQIGGLNAAQYASVQAAARSAGVNADDQDAVMQWAKDNAVMAQRAEAVGALGWADSQGENSNIDPNKLYNLQTQSRTLIRNSDQLLADVEGVNAANGDVGRVFGVINDRRGGTAFTPETSKIDTFGQGQNDTVWGTLQNLGLTDQQIADNDLVNQFGLSDPNKINAGQDLNFSPELRKMLEELIPKNTNREVPSLLPPEVAA